MYFLEHLHKVALGGISQILRNLYRGFLCNRPAEGGGEPPGGPAGRRLVPGQLRGLGAAQSIRHPDQAAGSAGVCG